MEATVYRRIGAPERAAILTGMGKDHPHIPARPSTRIINHPSSTIDPKGFTLIELLVVIGIIALLLAILLPTLSRVRKQARTMVCQAHLKQWGATWAMYVQDNDGYLPAPISPALILWGRSLNWSKLGVPPPPSNASSNRDGVHHHVPPKGIALCPMAMTPVADRILVDSGGQTSSSGTKILWAIWAGATFNAWELTGEDPELPFLGSYGFNVQLVFDSELPALGTANLHRFLPNGDARMPLLLDCTRDDAGGVGPPPAYEGQLTGIGVGAETDCINRHDGYVNGLFLDWSVRKVGLKELWTLKWHKHFDTANPWTKAGGVKPEDWPAWMRKFKDY